MSEKRLAMRTFGHSVGSGSVETVVHRKDGCRSQLFESPLPSSVSGSDSPGLGNRVAETE